MENNNPVQNPNPLPQPVLQTEAPQPEVIKVPGNSRNSLKFILIALVLLIIIVLSSGAYILNKNSMKSVATLPSPTPIATATTTPTPTPDSTADWISYTSPKGKFSLKYPPTWVQPTNKEACNPGMFDRTIYLGPDVNSVMRCATSYGGQMYADSVDGDTRDKVKSDEGFTNVQITSITVSGITGERLEAIYSGLTGQAAGLNDAKVVRYIFYSNNITFVANYIQEPVGLNPSKDVLKDFETMVSTLKFTDQASPTPTCKPRPACLNAKPRCMIAETADMCPPKVTPLP